jgi:hypothetical protein
MDLNSMSHRLSAQGNDRIFWHRRYRRGVEGMTRATQHCIGFGLGLVLALTLHSLVYATTPVSPADAASMAAVRGDNAKPGWALPNGFFPESIVVARDHTIYAGSAVEGSIVRIAPGKRASEDFIPAGAGGLMSVQGLLVDDAAGRLYACTADLGVAKTPKTDSALVAFHLATGAFIKRWPLPEGGFCNDIARAPQNNLLISDTAKPRLLHFDLRTEQLSVWIEHPLLGGAAFNGNGIAVDGNSVYLDTFADGRLLRVPLLANGRAGVPVEVVLPRPLAGADALRILSPGRLLVFENDIGGGHGQVSVIDVRKETATLETVAAGLAEPVSGALVGKQLIVVESQFRKLFGDGKGQVPAPFAMRAVDISAFIFAKHRAARNDQVFTFIGTGP